MRNIMSITFLIAVLVLSACATKIPRNKYTDKNTRIMIDPDSIPSQHYVRIQTALVKSGKFAVIDRAQGMQAVLKEQERLHRDQMDRFEDKEKWAHWGKLYGVGAIVVAHVQCYKDKTWWNNAQYRNYCQQFLSLVDANTGEVIVAVEGENDAPDAIEYQFQVAPDWDKVVRSFVDDYPKEYVPHSYAETLQNYQTLSAEEAQRQREVVAKK